MSPERERLPASGRDPGEPPDEELVAATLDGDRDAFGRLARRYQARATSVAYRLLGSSHDAAEVAQEAFLKAFRALATLDNPSRFGAWLLRIVGNLALNYRRSRSARRALSIDEADGGGSSLGERLTGEGSRPGMSGTDRLVGRELEEKIFGALDRLPEKQRLALVLFSVEGLPQKEVARIMECSVELVKWNVFSARKALRRLLADYIDG